MNISAAGTVICEKETDLITTLEEQVTVPHFTIRYTFYSVVLCELPNSSRKNEITPCNRALLDKVYHSASQGILSFMKPKGSLPCSQVPATGPYADQDAFTPHLPTLIP
jgi:hypothetical protein